MSLAKKSGCLALSLIALNLKGTNANASHGTLCFSDQNLKFWLPCCHNAESQGFAQATGKLDGPKLALNCSVVTNSNADII